MSTEIENTNGVTTEEVVPNTSVNNSNLPTIPEPKELISSSEIDLTDIRLRKSEIAKYRKTINIQDAASVNSFGRVIQQKAGSVCSNELTKIGMAELDDDTNKSLTGLVMTLNGAKIDPKDGFITKFFKKGQNKLVQIQTQHTSVMGNAKKSCEQLEGRMIDLTTNVKLYDRIFEINEENFVSLTELFIAGKQEIAEIKRTTLSDLVDKAKVSGKMEDYNAAIKCVNDIDRFERRISNIFASRVNALQQGPQIRGMQENDNLLVEAIQTAIDVLMPVFQNQILNRLSLERQKHTIEALNMVKSAVNTGLVENAKLQGQNSIAIAELTGTSMITPDTLFQVYDIITDNAKNLLDVNKSVRQQRIEAEKSLLERERQFKIDMETVIVDAVNDTVIEADYTIIDADYKVVDEDEDDTPITID